MAGRAPVLGRILRSTTLGLVALVLSGIPFSAWAQEAYASQMKKESSLTLYGGWRFGGSLDDETTGKSWDLKDAASYAMALDIGLDPRAQLQFFVSRQNSALKANDFAPTVNDIGLNITYFHVGGTYYLSRAGQGGYVVGGLGATYFEPDDDRLNSETKFSLNLGGGYMVPLGKHVGLRLEARAFVTLLNNSGGLFCGNSAGCVVHIQGDTLVQGDVMAGLSVRF
jgi:hypothetical protein